MSRMGRHLQLSLMLDRHNRTIDQQRFGGDDLRRECSVEVANRVPSSTIVDNPQPQRRVVLIARHSGYDVVCLHGIGFEMKLSPPVWFAGIDSEEGAGCRYPGNRKVPTFWCDQ